MTDVKEMTEMEQLMKMARDNIFSQFLQTEEQKDAFEIITIIGMLMA